MAGTARGWFESIPTDREIADILAQLLRERFGVNETAAAYIEEKAPLAHCSLVITGYTCLSTASCTSSTRRTGKV